VNFLSLPTLSKLSSWLHIALASYPLKKLPPHERTQAQQALAQLLANSRGMTLKIGQLMAGNTADNPYHVLVSSVTPLPLAQILPSLQSQFKQPLSDLFQNLEESQAAASLGQVHYAQLRDGGEVAIKIRYPGIVDTVTAELKLSAWLPNGGPFKRWQFNRADYQQTLRYQLLRETDYRLEAHTQQRFKEKLTVTGLHIPQVYLELTRAGVLVQAWETGVRLEQAAAWDKKARLEIGRTLLITVLQSVFVHGEVHADPHSGNYLFRQNAQGAAITVLLDYGCTVLINKQKRLALLKLIDAYRQGSEINTFSCFVAMGFAAEKLRHIEHELPALCEILFAPFIQSRAFAVETWQLASKLQALLGEKRWWFRAAGAADLLLLLRAFHGVVSQLSTLHVALPWGGLFHYAIPEPLLVEARALSLPNIPTLTSPPQVRITARKLCIRVYQNQQLSLSLDLPAEAALELDSLIPEAVRKQMTTDNTLDFQALQKKLQQGIYPQSLFDKNDGYKHYQVWLE
jgi:predicted unusual protein kinase regulating ubiquinone biosynthesis (AarF/ABC1/UbiB family)